MNLKIKNSFSAVLAASLLLSSAPVLAAQEESKDVTSDFTFVKDMDNLDPKATPYELDGIWFAKTTDGKIAVLNEDESAVWDKDYTSAVFYVPYTNTGDDAHVFNMVDAKGNKTLYEIKDGLAAPSDQAYGALTYLQTYDPETGDLYNYDLSTKKMVKLSDEERNDLRKVLVGTHGNQNTVSALYEYPGGDAVEASDIMASQTIYTWNLNTDQIDGPAALSDIDPWTEEKDGITTESWWNTYNALYPIKSDDGLYMIANQTKISGFDTIRTTSNGSAYCTNADGKYVYDWDGSWYELPESALYCSGVNNDHILILESDGWKLYELNAVPVLELGDTTGRDFIRLVGDDLDVSVTLKTANKGNLDVTADVKFENTPDLSTAGTKNLSVLYTYQGRTYSAQTTVYVVEDTGDTVMYRLYNPNSGEHFFTASSHERDVLIDEGWKYEGEAFTVPTYAKKAVYRLYNPNAGEHHYTMDMHERDVLKSLGWRDEGIGWFSDPEEGVKVYRVYNPNAEVGSHHYTADLNEYNTLGTYGWNLEGTSFFAVK